MTDKISKLPVKRKTTYYVFLVHERQPAYIEASEYHITANDDGTGALLEFRLNGMVVAVFNHWEYFECAAAESQEGVG